MEKVKSKVETIHDENPPVRDSFTVFITGRLRNYLSKHLTKALCVFRDIDDNGDGNLTCAEFRKGILEMGIPLELGELRRF